MADSNNDGPGLATLVGKATRTSLGALQNRGELLSVEWQEEKARLTEIFVWTALCLFLGILGVGMLTSFIIFLFREDLRIYALAWFALLYLAVAIVPWASWRGPS